MAPQQTQQMVPLSSLNFDPSEIQSTHLYKELKRLGIPEELCLVFGNYDVLNGYAYQSLAAQMAKAIDRTAANLRLDSYVDDDRQDSQRDRDLATGVLLGNQGNFQQTQVVNTGLGIAVVGPGAVAPTPPASPTPFLQTFTILAAQVGSRVVGDPIALNSDGYAILSDANTYIGPAYAISGNQVTVILPGPVVSGLTGLTPGTIYYQETPGTATALLEFGDLTAGRVARARYIAITETSAIVVNWPAFEVSP